MFRELESNPWFVGIVCGIASGFVLLLVGQWFGRKRQNREYQKDLRAAKREVLDAIRPGVPSGRFPTSETIASHRRATALKYGVRLEDLDSHVSIGDELIKEVMDSSLVTVRLKAEYSRKIMEKFSVDSEKRDAQEEHGNSEGSRRVLYIPAYAVHTLASFALIYGLIRYRGITFLDQHLFFVGMADALAIFVMVSWATIILAERFSQPEARER